MRTACRHIAAVLVALGFGLAAAGADTDAISGTVRDPLGAVVVDAEVDVLTSDRTVVRSTRTSSQGAFTIPPLAPGSYLIVVRSAGFAEERRAVQVRAGRTTRLDVTLSIAGIVEDVTVTAARDEVEAVGAAGQPVNVIASEEIGRRAKTVVAQAVEGEAGVALQQTSPSMAGVFVRGLTGNKVSVYVDGVRYSNGAQRGGVNTFLDLIEPALLDSIEVLRGPSSAQYGSDALGGSVQFLSRAPALAVPGGPRFGGTLSVGGGTAHRYGGGSVLMSFMRPSFGAELAFSGRGTGRLRPGGGIDSHAAVTRFFGIPSTRLMDERLPDTGFHQMGGFARMNWTRGPNTQVAATYMRAVQGGGSRYDQLLGGDGNLIADLNGLSLDFLSVRLERLGGRLFQHASLAYSLNSQREERVNQGGNGNPRATIGHEPERTTVHGLQGSVSRQLTPRQTLSFGGDIYFERLRSDAFDVNPLTGTTSVRRPRVPDRAAYRHGGLYAQTAVDLLPDRLRLTGAVRAGGARYSARASDSPLVNGLPLWPDDSLSTSSLTFRASAIVQPASQWTMSASVSRGFRAPHMTDLGTLGLTGSGFEVAAPDVAGLGGTTGSTADENAVSTGRPVEQLRAETSLDFDGSVSYRTARWRTDLTAFVNDIHGNIQKQALILPPGAVGLTLGGQTITSQSPTGVVFVPAATTPVLVRANFDNARVSGVEHTLSVSIGSSWSARTAFTYLRATDTTTGLPPNIEGGTPAPDLYLSARWIRPGGRLWVEPYAHVAWRQAHLSSLDVGDRRTGSSRSRSSIRSFFLNGATARGWIDPGADGVIGTADDVLTVTGETLAQIQDRVLGVGVNSSVLFSAVPGYAVGGLRAGYRAGAHELTLDVENLTDRNYRGISWGVDAPGRGVSLRYVVRF